MKTDKPTKIYRVDHTQFLTSINEELSYILGLLWADGTIYKNAINVELKKEDMLALLPTFESIGSWNYYERQRVKKGLPFGSVQSQLNTSNKHLVNFLISMDYKNKTVGPRKILQHIGDQYETCFWHGFFDGDGCLYIGNGANKSITLQFWSGIDQDWSPLTTFLQKHDTSYKIWKYERQKPSGVVHRSSCLGVKNTNSIRNILSLFYDKESKGLVRKYDKYLKLVENINNRKKKYPVGERYY
jgi:hypothetical protein